jgi:hypothetical protein
MLPLGHIAGIPVEETALSFGPVLLASGGILGLKLRDRWARVRRAPKSALHRGTTYGAATVSSDSPRGKAEHRDVRRMIHGTRRQG